MSSNLKIALIGAGQRGMIYAGYAYEQPGIEIVAVVEPDEGRRLAAAKRLSLDSDQLFTDTESFWKKGKLADALIIASMDQNHFEQTMSALDLGYDILLEKPISPNPSECIKIERKAKETGCKVIVCHVLRYTNFFSTIKQILDNGELGRIITIQHNENIGNFHMAHSFVRGNWRKSELTSPIIMQKSCHDMDILCWLTGKKAKRISSFGSLIHFKEANAPKGSTNRCTTCPVASKCRAGQSRSTLLPGFPCARSAFWERVSGASPSAPRDTPCSRTSQSNPGRRLRPTPQHVRGATTDRCDGLRS